MPGKIALLLLLGAFGGSGYLALQAMRSEEGAPASRAPASEGEGTPAGMPPAPPATSPRYEPEEGTRYVYAFERRISFTREPGAPALPELDYKGELYLDVVRAGSGSFEALLSASVAGAGAPIPPLRLEAGARGDSLALFASASTEESQAAVLKDLVSLWLFPLRSDTVGAFEARFEPLPPENGLARERKTKLAYHRRAGAAALPELLSSLHLLHWDPRLRLPARVEGSENARLGGPGSAFEARSRYALRFRTRARIPALSKELLASLHREDSLALNTAAAKDLREHPEHSGLDWNALLGRLRGIAALDGGEQLELFGDLLRYARMHPGKTAELAALLRDPALLRLGIDSPAFKTIVGTLATLGTPEALKALREAYEDPALAATGKSSILAAITTTQAAIDAPTRDFLARKLETERDPRLAQSAGFALGSALQHAPGDEQALRSIAQIEDRWRTAQSHGSTADRLAVLDIIGNSGRAEFLPGLQEVIAGDSAPILRARAVLALRFIPGAAGASELAARLRDSEPLVREAAAQAMGLGAWNEAFREALESCSSSERESRIQEQCRRALAKGSRVADAR